MSAQSQPLQKLEEYDAKIRGTNYGQVTVGGDEEDYAGRLSKSLQSLQNQVKQYEAALEKVFHKQSFSLSALSADCWA